MLCVYTIYTSRGSYLYTKYIRPTSLVTEERKKKLCAVFDAGKGYINAVAQHLMYYLGPFGSTRAVRAHIYTLA